MHMKQLTLMKTNKIQIDSNKEKINLYFICGSLLAGLPAEANAQVCFIYQSFA